SNGTVTSPRYDPPAEPDNGTRSAAKPRSCRKRTIARSARLPLSRLRRPPRRLLPSGLRGAGCSDNSAILLVLGPVRSQQAAGPFFARQGQLKIRLRITRLILRRRGLALDAICAAGATAQPRDHWRQVRPHPIKEACPDRPAPADVRRASCD